MARTARIKAKNQIYSVVTRVNNSSFHFQNADIATAFLDHIKIVKQKLQFKLYGFVIMSTHIHLLIQSNDEIADISEIMKHINGYFAVKFNRYHKTKGHFWMERFKSKIVQDLSYLVNTIIYFALNPVKAGIIKNPLNYKFSSINNIKDITLFADVLDPLPPEYKKALTDFLEKERFLEIISNLATRTYLGLKYSFNLKKTKQAQIYKKFIGGYSFIKKGVLAKKIELLKNPQ